MSLIKNILLFGGWAPTLLGGATGVWWLTSDKTVEDALKRTGLSFLNSPSEFQEVFIQFEDDGLFDDIPSVKSQEGKAISDWCKETLALPLNTENVDEILSKSMKYCIGNKRTVSGKSKFNNFEKIIKLLDSSGVKREARAGLVMSHLGSEKSKDTYYLLNNERALENEEWTVFQTSRENVFQRKLFIDSKYKILSTSSSTDIDGKWNKKAEEYEKSSEKIPGLKEAFQERNTGITREGTLPIQRVNLIRVKCSEYLKQRFPDEQSLEDAHKHFIRWCLDK